jgi:hypothetical protein
MSKPIDALANNYARDFHKFTERLQTHYAQLSHFLTYQIKEDQPGSAPKKGEKAKEEVLNGLSDVARDISRFTDAQLASLKHYGMISTDRARDLIREQGRSSITQVNAFANALHNVRLTNDPAQNVRAIAALNDPVHRIVTEFNKNFSDFLVRLRNG